MLTRPNGIRVESYNGRWETALDASEPTPGVSTKLDIGALTPVGPGVIAAFLALAASVGLGRRRRATGDALGHKLI